MKRIKLYDNILTIIKEYDYQWEAAAHITNFIQNNYRRRQYKKTGYTCNTCLKFHKSEYVCKKVK